MSDVSAKLYEGMFLINQQNAAGDLSAAMEHVTEIFNRAKAEVVVLHKWDERRLAYPIKGQKRGLYIYSLFNVEGAQLANIERDCNLSELVMRVMVLRADRMGETEIALAKDQAVTSSVEASLRDDSADASGEVATSQVAADAGEAATPGDAPSDSEGSTDTTDQATA